MEELGKSVRRKPSCRESWESGKEMPDAAEGCVKGGERSDLRVDRMKGVGDLDMQALIHELWRREPD